MIENWHITLHTADSKVRTPWRACRKGWSKESGLGETGRRGLAAAPRPHQHQRLARAMQDLVAERTVEFIVTDLGSPPQDFCDHDEYIYTL